MNAEQVQETKVRLAACVGRAEVRELVHEFEQLLKAPVNVEITVSVLDPDRQPRKGGFQKAVWHDGQPIRIDAGEDHVQFPPIQPETTLTTATYREGIEARLNQCFDKEQATELLREIEAGTQPAELELRAYSLFILINEGRHMATPVTLGRIHMGSIDTRGIQVVPNPEATAHREEADKIAGTYDSVCVLDDLIDSYNLLFASIEQSAHAGDVFSRICAELEPAPGLIKHVTRLIDLLEDRSVAEGG